MRPPGFWFRPPGAAAALLAPAAMLVAAATARRVTRPGWCAPVPVICCGNAGVGGAGKTTLALDLGRRLLARGVAPAFLTRGYGGRARGPVRVDPDRHHYREVGDEALLLAEVAPTVVAVDRAAGARLAVAAGCGAIVMDDGLQNPTLARTASLLVIDGASGFGNGRVLPAGPLREPVAAAARRCAAAVLIGPDRAGAAAALPPSLTMLRASLRSAYEPAAWGGQPLVAFAGIGRPDKFFASLEAAGARVLARHGFPDHHPYGDAEVTAILRDAERAGAVAVTTPKDAVRLPPALRHRVRAVGVALVWEKPRGIEAVLDAALAAGALGDGTPDDDALADRAPAA